MVSNLKVLTMCLLVSLAANANAVSYKDDPRGTHNSGNGWGGPPDRSDNGGGNGNNGGSNGYTVNIYEGNTSQAVLVKNTSSSIATTSADAQSDASATAMGGAGGSATVNVYPDSSRTASSDTAGASRTTKTKIEYSGSYTAKGYSPDAVPPFTTADCYVGAAGSTWWFGLSIPFKDEGCDVWRDHRNLLARGDAIHTQAADMRLCDKKEIAKLLPYCKQQEQEQNPAASGWSH